MCPWTRTCLWQTGASCKHTIFRATAPCLLWADPALCAPCSRARLRGSFCAVCRGCYEEDDYDCSMMECGQCGGWIHARCEGLDGEQYQVLSYLPDTVEYTCK